MPADASLGELLDLVPALVGERKVTVLPGGLTNTNYKVVTANGAFVVRRWTDDSGLLAIDRDNEHQNSLAAASAGVGAPVIAHLPDQRALVLGFLEGRTLSSADLRSEAMLTRVAASCSRLHQGPRFRDDFNMFDIQARYLGIVRERGFRLPDRYDDFQGHVAAIRDALAVREEGTVPCNNDLLAENFIDDGTRIWMIDYEYSGNNEACFELGNLWSLADLDLAHLETLITAYHGAPSRSRVARALLWGLMSNYGWTLWACIQDGISQIDFDFWEWGLGRYERAVREFTGPNFEMLLAHVVQPD